MKWIKDFNGDFFNLEMVSRVLILDSGPEYQERYCVTLEINSVLHTVKKYRSESGAEKYMNSIVEFE